MFFILLQIFPKLVTSFISSVTSCSYNFVLKNKNKHCICQIFTNASKISNQCFFLSYLLFFLLMKNIVIFHSQNKSNHYIFHILQMLQKVFSRFAFCKTFQIIKNNPANLLIVQSSSCWFSLRHCHTVWLQDI